MKIAGLLCGVALAVAGCGVSDDEGERCQLDDIEARGTPVDTSRRPSVSCGELSSLQLIHSEEELTDAGCTATDSIDFVQSAVVVGTNSTTTQLRSATLDGDVVVIGFSLVGGCRGDPPGVAEFTLLVPAEVDEVTVELCTNGAEPCTCGGMFNPCPP